MVNRVEVILIVFGCRGFGGCVGYRCGLCRIISRIGFSFVIIFRNRSCCLRCWRSICRSWTREVHRNLDFILIIPTKTRRFDFWLLFSSLLSVWTFLYISYKPLLTYPRIRGVPKDLCILPSSKSAVSLELSYLKCIYWQ